MIGDILQPTHLLFILVIALLVLGPKRLPEVGKSLGKGLRDFRVALSSNEEAEQLRDGFREARDHMQEAHETLQQPISMQPATEQQPPARADQQTAGPAVAGQLAPTPQPGVAPEPVESAQPQPPGGPQQAVATAETGQPTAPPEAPANGEVQHPDEPTPPAQPPVDEQPS